MKPVVMKLGEAKFDLPLLLQLYQKLFHSDLARPLTSNGQDYNKPVNYMVLLASLREPNVKPRAVLDDPGHLMQHTWFQFVVLCDRSALLALASETDCKIHSVEYTATDHMAIVSGDLEAFHRAILNLTSPIGSFELRTVLNSIQLILEKDGYKFDSRKVSLPDGTFNLIERG